MAQNNPIIARGIAALVFLSTVCLSIYNLHFHPMMIDDSYIGFRIAKNFALGNGLVYNSGERVMTSTTTLYALLNGVLWKMLGEYTIGFVLLLNVVWHSMTACFLSSFVYHSLAAKSVHPNIAYISSLFAALFFSYSSAVAPIATSGMETPFYTFFICLSFYLYFEGRQNWAVAVSTVPFLIRPEGFLVSVAIMSCIFLAGRKIHVSHICIIASIVITYLVALYLYYGTIIPQSVPAKKLHAINHGEVISEFLKTYFFSLRRFPLGFLFFSGLYYSIKIDRKLLPFIVWGVLYAVFFTLIASWWRWYKPPFYMVYSCVIALGIYFWAELIHVRFPRRTWIIAGPALLSGVLILIAGVDESKKLQNDSLLFQGIFKESKHVAEAIVQNSTRDQFVMLEPLGFIGFHAFDRKFKDFPGLCSPAVVTSLKKLGRKLTANLDDYEALRILNEDVKPTLFVLRKREYDINEEKGTMKNYQRVGYVPMEFSIPDRPDIAEDATYYIMKRTTGNDKTSAD